MEWSLPDEIPGWTLGEVLRDAADGFRNCFEAFYGLNEAEAAGYTWGFDASTGETRTALNDQHLQAVEIYRLASKLFSGSTSLVRPTRLPEQQLELLQVAAESQAELEEEVTRLEQECGRTLRADGAVSDLLNPKDLEDPRGRLQFLLRCFEFQAHLHIAPDVQAMARRMFTLLSVMVRNPSELSQAYLSRVALCYCYGMDAEFAVMARATLDQCIQEVIDDSEVEKAVGLGVGKYINLERRIVACRTVGVFDARVAQAADMIRERGNNAVHLSPGLAGSSDELLEELSTALAALSVAKGT